jgi:hypothetical protein
MDDTDLRLDGNAAAGLLSEVFAAEMTTAVGTCGSCGRAGPFGATHVYRGGPGTVVRCPQCSAVLMCVVRVRGRLLVDTSGIRRIELR